MPIDLSPRARRERRLPAHLPPPYLVNMLRRLRGLPPYETCGEWHRDVDRADPSGLLAAAAVKQAAARNAEVEARLRGTSESDEDGTGGDGS